MVGKSKYLKKFTDLHFRKTGVLLADDVALEYFEKLVALVGVVTSHVPAKKIIIPKYDL